MPGVRSIAGASARSIAHVDMDAFFAAIEQRDRPELLGRPVIVGADPGGRGVVATASYEARRFGVGSAMPIREAARRCPTAVFLPVDRPRYEAVSQDVMAVLAEFSPLVEPASLDEAWVDLTGTEACAGAAPETVRRIRSVIRSATGLTASVGLATSKFVAKVASDLRKPDGCVVVPPGSEMGFLAPLGVERVAGVGPTTARALAELGVRTIGDLQRLSLGVLARRLGAAGARFYDLARGIDERPVVAGAARASVGAETTFPADRTGLEPLVRELRVQAERVAASLRREGCRAGRVTLKLRFADFRTITRAVAGDPTEDGLEIYIRARRLLEREAPREPVRLIGLAASALRPAGSGQLSLFEGDPGRRERLGRAIDALADRFGDGTVRPAVALPDLPMRPTRRSR